MDVGVQGEKIVALGWPGTLAGDAARVIDARGKIVVPGGIEPHAHIGIPVPEHWAGTPDVMTQPPEAATRAAAFGGVTTVIDFAGDLELEPAPRPRRGADRRRTSSGDAPCSAATRYTDFAFHYILAGEVAPQTDRRDRRGHPGGRRELQDLHDVPPDPRAVRPPVEHLRRGGASTAASWPCTRRRTTSSPT